MHAWFNNASYFKVALGQFFKHYITVYIALKVQTTCDLFAHQFVAECILDTG